MSADSEETKQHFQFRNLDADMRKAYSETSQVKPRDYVQRIKADNRGILVTLAFLLAAIAAIASHLLGIY